MYACAVHNCFSKRNDTSRHMFPNPKKDLVRFKEWVLRCSNPRFSHIDNDHIFKGYSICGFHFLPSDYYSNKRLNKTAIPSLHLGNVVIDGGDVIEEIQIVYNPTTDQKTEKSRPIETNQTVISPTPLEEAGNFINIKITHICLFCMKILDNIDEINIHSNMTKEGKHLEGFIKTSLLFMNLDEHLESYFLCLNCLDKINILEGYFTKCKEMKECLFKQYTEHKQSKYKRNSNDNELLTLNAVEDGRQTIDLTIQCNTKDYATRGTQTYAFSTQLEEENSSNGLLSMPDENEMNVEMNAVDENIINPDMKPTTKERKIKIDPHSSSGYCCDKCGKVFWKYKAYNKHDLWHRNENKFRCEICNKTFSDRYVLKKHSLVHSGICAHECETCGKKFRTHFQLDKHNKSVHPSAADSNGYCCETCGKLYVSYYGFKMHSLTHRFANKLRCEICDKSFAQRGGLQRHIQIHQGIRPFACEICGKRFSTKSQFEAHSNSHSGKRNYQCDTCGKAFVTGPNLTNHMKTHLTIKPYTCTGCGKGFSHNCNLKKHMKIAHKNDYI